MSRLNEPEIPRAAYQQDAVSSVGGHAGEDMSAVRLRPGEGKMHPRQRGPHHLAIRFPGEQVRAFAIGKQDLGCRGHFAKTLQSLAQLWAPPGLPSLCSLG